MQTKTKILYLLVTLFLISPSCQKYMDKEYNLPINEMVNIKTNYGYGGIELTMEKYYGWNQEIVASFLYKGQKASVKMNFELSDGNIEFINIGKESDYFLIAMADLFDEKLRHTKMKDKVVMSFGRKGDNPYIDIFDKENDYTSFYRPNTNNFKGSVEIRMKIDMDAGKIDMWERNGGIAKKNLVKAFEK